MEENEFFEAIYSGNIEKVKLAIAKFGVDPNVAHSRGGHTPLQAACQIDSVDLIKLLLDLGASPNHAFTRIDVGGRVIEKNSVPISSVKSAKAGEILLQAGADIEWVDDFGYTPLIWAIKRRSFDVVDFLCKSGVKIKRKLNVKGKKITASEFLDDEVKSYKEILGDNLTEKQIHFFREYEAIKERLSRQASSFG